METDTVALLARVQLVPSVGKTELLSSVPVKPSPFGKGSNVFFLHFKTCTWQFHGISLQAFWCTG